MQVHLKMNPWRNGLFLITFLIYFVGIPQGQTSVFSMGFRIIACRSCDNAASHYPGIVDGLRVPDGLDPVMTSLAWLVWKLPDIRSA